MMIQRMKMNVDQADVDAMDQDLEAIPSESETNR
jgi:hypothetical protein